MEAIVVTDEVSDRPVFRPLVAMDKWDIIALSHDMGAYETSILPYEDCCTIFVPKHPLTNPKLKYIKQHEEILDIDGLVERAISGEEVFRL
jgi:thiamine biosynthesis protein ThiI